MRRSSSPSRSSGRERKSIHTLWPSAESLCSGEAAIDVPPEVVITPRLPIARPVPPASTPGMSADHLLLLALLAAPSPAGWGARRGGQPRPAAAPAPGAAPPPPPPA